MSRIIRRLLNPVPGLLIAGLCAIAPNASANDDWFPTTFVGTVTNKEGMTFFSEKLIQGFKLLLFAICIYCFYQFVLTVSHGIEAAKKSESGLMAVFSSYAVMSFLYLAISIASAYFGFTAVSKFSL
ncbi:hypothetical protein [Legionella fairfieldensis]|uniref:hypothetical protein n=1 Tax=Legionella fairfieldensis TaxID=45064 RepID=UPI000685920A|nr:hypothetical protein [Legionella fairfieldensis]